MEKDFNIKVTVRNGRLLNAIRENYNSVAEFARQLGRSHTSVNNLVTMKAKPFNQNGWTDLALDVATFAGKEPEDLWPEYMREVRLPRATAELNADLNEVQAIQSSTSPEKQIAQLDAIKKIAKVLTPRELNVIRNRFVDEMTLDEAAKEEGVSRERLRQLEAKALRKMQYSAYLKGFMSKHDNYKRALGYDLVMTGHARSLLADEE